MFHIIRSMWPKIHTADGEVNALFLGKEKQINKKNTLIFITTLIKIMVLMHRI